MLQPLVLLLLPISIAWLLVHTEVLANMSFLRFKVCVALSLLCVPTTVLSQPTVAVLNGSDEGVYSPSFNQDFFLGIPTPKTPEARTGFESLSLSTKRGVDAGPPQTTAMLVPIRPLKKMQSTA